LMQCVRGDRVVCFDRIRKVARNEAAVVDKLGVAPSQVPDYLALIGDSADGIPGIPRWGAKSAATVLSAYPGIADIPDDERAWTVKVRGAAALAESLRQRRQVALLYRKLATLRTDVPLPEEL